MSTTTQNLPCPICGSDSQFRNLESAVVKRYICPRCGTFDIDRVIEAYSKSGSLWAETKHLVSAWIRRQNNAEIFPIVGKNFEKDLERWGNQLKDIGLPSTIDEKLNALLLAYAETVKHGYTRILDSLQPHLIADIAAKDYEELEGLTTLLIELGFINQEVSIDQDKYVGSRKISAKGWLRIDELKKAKIISDSAFIAMWFSDVTKPFRDSATAAIEYCGYKAIIVDQQEYNGFIMDQVISLIRQSRFLIADFTCRREEEVNGKVHAGIRGGVYWEAGMAFGLGKPVIHTCEDNDDAKKRRHFDIDQYNTIFWKQNDLSTNIRNLSEGIDNPNFAEKLSARIIATVGKGSLLKQTTDR